jgi:hypothetical protein
VQLVAIACKPHRVERDELLVQFLDEVRQFSCLVTTFACCCTSVLPCLSELLRTRYIMSSMGNSRLSSLTWENHVNVLFVLAVKPSQGLRLVALGRAPFGHYCLEHPRRRESVGERYRRSPSVVLVAECVPLHLPSVTCNERHSAAAPLSCCCCCATQLLRHSAAADCWLMVNAFICCCNSLCSCFCWCC